jgi:hypothetical protein
VIITIGRIRRTSSAKSIYRNDGWPKFSQLAGSATRWISRLAVTRSATLQINVSWRLVKTESTLSRSASPSQKRTNQAGIRITIKMKCVSIEFNFYAEYASVLKAGTEY